MTNSDAVRVLVVDDHPMTAFGITMILQKHGRFNVCGQAGSVREAIELFRSQKPDVVLMDLRLPDGHGIEAIRSMRCINSRAKIIVVTTYEGDEDIHQALQNGAMGYLVKGLSHDVLIRAVQKVAEGNRFLPPPVTRTLQMRNNQELSPREKEVLKLIVAGKTNREIADVLDIREATVKGHVTQILSRLGVTDRTQAVVSALRRGLEHI